MLDIMTQSKNAIEAYEQALKISNTNITNLTTPGFKKLDVSFQSIFEKVLSQGTAASSDTGGTNPRQFGQGMALSNIGIDFANGDTTTTNNPLNLAIQGAGLFIVSADGGNSFLYTRAGNFQLNSGSLQTTNGMQVYGLDNSGALVPITGLGANKTATDFQWTTGGNLQLSDSTETGYRIALTTFGNPNGLAQSQGTTFAETMASGSPATPAAATDLGVTLIPKSYEKSNVNYFEETIKVAELQRSISANLSMVKLASDLISSFIQKLG